MVLDRDLVKRLADLASLELQEPEVVRIAADLERFLGHVAYLAEIDQAEASDPSGDAGPATLRADEPVASLPRDVALGQAPRANEEGFVVPRFVDGG